MTSASNCPACHGLPCTCRIHRPVSIGIGPKNSTPASSSRSTRSSAIRGVPPLLFSGRLSSMPSTETRTTTGSPTPSSFSPVPGLTIEIDERVPPGYIAVGGVVASPGHPTLYDLIRIQEQPIMPRNRREANVDEVRKFVESLLDSELDAYHRAVKRETMRRIAARRDKEVREVHDAAFARGELPADMFFPDTAGLDYDEKYVPEYEVSVHGNAEKVREFLMELTEAINRPTALIQSQAAELQNQERIINRMQTAIAEQRQEITLLRQGTGLGPMPSDFLNIPVRVGANEPTWIRLEPIPNDSGPAAAAEPAHDPVSPD